MLFSVTWSNPNYPNHPIFDILFRLSYLRSEWSLRLNLNLVGRLTVANQILAHRRQTIPEKGLARSREPFKFWWAPTISLERLIVSGTVNLVCRCVINFWWSSDKCWSHPQSRSVFSSYRSSKWNGLIAIWCDTEYLARAEPLRRAGLSAAGRLSLYFTVFDVQWDIGLKTPIWTQPISIWRPVGVTPSEFCRDVWYHHQALPDSSPVSKQQGAALPCWLLHHHFQHRQSAAATLSSTSPSGITTTQPQHTWPSVVLCRRSYSLEFASRRAPRSRLYRRPIQTVAEDIHVPLRAALVCRAR